MKDLISCVLFGRNTFLGGILSVVVIALVVLGCSNLGNKANSGSNANGTVATDDGKDPDMPDDRLLKATVKLTTAEFANAISTEDFTKLHGNASPDFQQTYTPEQAKEIFADAIKNKRALLPMLAKLVSIDPEFTQPPYIRREDNTPILVVKGKYDTKPRPLEFEYEYVKRVGSYKLLKLILK